MRCKFEDTIKYKGTTLKEHIAPVPPVILDYVVSFRLDPQIECNQGETSNPAVLRKPKDTRCSEEDLARTA